MSKKCTPLWREAHLEVKMQKKSEGPGALLARSTFGSENVKKTDGLGALFGVETSKNCTRLWRKAHFEEKMYETRQQRTVFGSYDVEK